MSLLDLGGMANEKLAESEGVQRMVAVFASLERQQLEAAVALGEAVGIDTPDSLPPVDLREETLQGVLSASVTGTFPEWWREHVAPERYERTPPEDLIACGRDSERWDDQLDTWADRVREVGGKDSDDRQLLADYACREVYGVPLDRFEREVVEMDPGAEVNRIVSGNFRVARGLIEEATAEIDADDDQEGDGE